MVAFAMLIGFVVPRLFASTLRTPASSSTARTPPPAITPVPSEAGRSITRAASNRPSTSWVIVDPCFGTVYKFFLASSTALVIARGTSRALPYPTPTRSFSSPTTTSAVNEKRRPPLTTLATRLISTTRSWRSRPAPLTVLSMRMRIGKGSSEREPALPRSLRKRLDLAVIEVAAAVEDHARDAGGLTALGDQRPGPARALGARQRAQLGLGPVDRCERAARDVVDQLGGDAAVGAKDGDAGPLGGARDLRADTAAA